MSPASLAAFLILVVCWTEKCTRAAGFSPRTSSPSTGHCGFHTIKSLESILKVNRCAQTFSTHHAWNPQRYRYGRPSTRNHNGTAIGLGIRSFLRKRLDDIDNEDKRVMKPPFKKKEKTSGSNSDVEKSDDSSEHELSIENESLSGRINRIQSGGMTEDEKVAFLNTALSRTSIRAPPPPIIRQAPPLSVPKETAYVKTDDSTDADEDAISSNVPSPSNILPPSPFPSDSLWGTVIGAGTERTQNILNKSAKLEDERKSTDDDGEDADGGIDEAQKRAWFNMVTDPNRFKNYAVIAPSSPETASTDSDSVIDSGNDDTLDAGIGLEDDIPVAEREEPVAITKELIPSTVASSTEAPPNDDLASRLEQAAILHEQASARREKEREEREQKELEKLRLLQEQEEERLRKEREEAVAKQKAKMEAQKREEEIRRVEEERLRKEMEEAQAKYWKKKLEQEEIARQARLEKQGNKQSSARDIIGTMPLPPVPTPLQPTVKQPQKKREVPISSPSISQEDEPQTVPDEGIVDLKQESIQSRLPERSVSDFVKEQNRKRAEYDNMLRLQRQRLRDLSSPLPSPTKRGGVKPMAGRSATTEKLTSENTGALPTARKLRRTNLPTELSRERLPKAIPTSPISEEMPSVTKLVSDWKDLGKSPDEEVTKAEDKDFVTISTRSGAQPETPSPTPRLSLQEMTKYKGDRSSTSVKETTAIQSASVEKKSDVGKKTPIRQAINLNVEEASRKEQPQQKRAPIRQKLNLDDANDDENMKTKKGPIRMRIALDDTEGGDDAAPKPLPATKKPNIDKDQKAKAKTWGIDLDLLL